MFQKSLLIFIGIVIGGSLVWFIPHPQTGLIKPIRSGGYKLVNPLLECDQIDVTSELKPFKSKVENLVNNYLSSNTASHISVYFRDMNNGPWFGINEKSDFSPASLLKVPVMMSIFKQAESDPMFLQKTVTATSSADANAKETFKPTDPIIFGNNYSILELVERMISKSDNNAVTLIYQNFDLKNLLKTYQDLGVYGSASGNPDQYMNVKTYASFFRILFNASYLNPEMSEKALEILSFSDFSDGLRAGVPNTVTVAHKFGERELLDQNLVQLHDCGIIYYPGHPYLLCIMTRGKSLASLTSVIKNISSVIYTEINGQYKTSKPQ